MAELVGVISSGIGIATLAAQITDSVIKLKSYWDQLKDASEDLQLLIEEIEDLNLLLSEIEKDQQRNPLSSRLLGSTAASKCFEHCKRGADRLKELTTELGLEIKAGGRWKKRWASAKVVLKKDRLEKYRSRLERASRSLSLAHQIYTRFVTRKCYL